MACSSESRMRQAAETADRLVTRSVPKVPKALKLVRTSSGTDRMEVMAGLVAVIAMAVVTGYPPDGCDPLDFVGAGVGLGAGAGGDGGGASVGEGFGADEVGWLVGWVLAGPLPGEAAADRELEDADAPGSVELCADADGDPLAFAVPPEVAAPFALWAVADALCAAVFENKVVSPNAAMTLRRVARQVSRDRRRSPVSRLALRVRCLTDKVQQRLG
jgi:hypothetical protein